MSLTMMMMMMMIEIGNPFLHQTLLLPSSIFLHVSIYVWYVIRKNKTKNEGGESERVIGCCCG